MSKNYFLDDDTAVRYNQYRPVIHDAIVDRIASFCLPNPSVEKALDVACGTGHSTYPLQRVAQEKAFGMLVKQGEESFEEVITTDQNHLLNYLTTQSNITRVLDEERETLPDMRAWLESFYSTESQ